MTALRVAELLERERRVLRERTPGSEALFRRAQRTLPGGVASSFQRREPWPVYVSRGEGARVWDVDGNEYIDFHNGFSAMVQGHAHPAIGAAVERRLALGTHFGAPTEEAVAVSEELARRFGLPSWRFTNSGTESTMDAIRIARALHRPRRHREGRRRLPRPPRPGDGERAHDHGAALGRGDPAVHRRADAPRGVQRRGGSRAPHRRARRRRPSTRLRDRRAGDDEGQGRRRPRPATSRPSARPLARTGRS